MCLREGVSLQRGMNYKIGRNHSVILMSIRPNAPYADRFENDGSTIIYEGHDVPNNRDNPNPKNVDQMSRLPSGRLTENGKFYLNAIDYKEKRIQPERIRVYEKIKSGIWSYNGVFHLVDSWQERSNNRLVYKFKLVAVEGEEDFNQPIPNDVHLRRIIPTKVKLEVWKRDGGKILRK